MKFKSILTGLLLILILSCDEDTSDNSDNINNSTDGHGVEMLINTEQHETLIGDLRVEYNRTNLVEQGFVFRRLTKGTVCGCGESFTPLGSDKPLGWDT